MMPWLVRSFLSTYCLIPAPAVFLPAGCLYDVESEVIRMICTYVPVPGFVGCVYNCVV